MASSNTDSDSSTIRQPVAEGPNVSSKHITVSVGVGQDARDFYVHEALLTRHSELFLSALGNGWKEAGERAVRLPDDLSENFEVFARFLYTGKVFSQDPDNKTSDDPDEWTRLTKCWILGDKLRSITFKDAICDALCEKIKNSIKIPLGLHVAFYPATKAAVPARRLVVDVAVWKWSKE